MDKEISIHVTDKMYNYLKTLVERGLHGASDEEAARRLVEEGIKKEVEWWRKESGH